MPTDIARWIFLWPAALLVLGTPALAQGSSASCLEFIAENAAKGIPGIPPGSWTVINSDDINKVWKADGNGGWKVGTYYGHASGAKVSPNINEITIFGKAILSKSTVPNTSTSCSPEFLAEVISIMPHEMLHFVCPVHTPKPGASTPTSAPAPSVPSSPPDCNDINYAVYAASEVCSTIGDIAACLESGWFSTPPDPPLVDDPCDLDLPPGYTPDPSDDQGELNDKKEDLEDLCAALSVRHDSIRTRYNTAANAAIAYDCACGSGATPPWSPTGCPNPGDPCPDCPNSFFFVDSDGDGISDACEAASTPQDFFPGNSVIPACNNSCP